jgi:hypothetical protein
LRPAFPRLKDKLEDPDPSVVSAAVNVICELARRNPKNYISLAPTLYKILTTSTNNWMLIKIVKLVSDARLAEEVDEKRREQKKKWYLTQHYNLSPSSPRCCRLKNVWRRSWSVR